MSEAMTTRSIKTFFKFPFQGPNWQSRFLIGAGLALASFLVPIVPLIFVNGYTLRVMRQAIEGEDLAMPDWEDWGGLATDGLRMMLVGLVYLLPGTIVLVGGMILYWVILTLLAVATEGGSEPALGASLLYMVSIGIMFLSMLVGLALSLLGGIPLPMATAHFVAQDKVAAAFRVREWWAVLRNNRLGYFIAWVVVAGLMAILYFLTMMVYYTMVLCCLIPFLGATLGFYLSLVGAAMFGHAYREGAAALSSGE
jgi:hypothetical protein